jgi:penicillin-binding protein 2
MFFQKYSSKKARKRSLEIEDVTQAGLAGKDEEMAVREPMSDWGLRLFRNAAILTFLLLALRVSYLQIAKGDHFSELARENRMRYIAVKAPRGMIFDRSGQRLVQNIPSFDVVLVPADLPKDTNRRNEEARKLAAMLKLNDQSLQAITNSQVSDSLKPVLIKENISEEEALVFSEKKNELSGFQLDKTAIRQYEKGGYFSPVIGYTGKINREEIEKYPQYSMTDYVGKLGIEYSHENYLRGVDGKQKVEVDSAGNVKKNLGTENPTNGNDLYLGLDADLQEKIVDVLQDQFEKTGTKTAAVVAVDPRNGEIRALVSLPSYDNNLFARGISSEDYQKLLADENKPMFNRAISGEYPPGSVFKPLVATAALEEKTINSGTSVECHGGFRIGGYNFPDWKTHGATDVRKAIAESCDVFFYSIGGGWEGISGLGMDRMKKYADLFSLGKKTGIDIPGEATGLIPDKQWKENKFGERWYVGDDYHCAIGQGFITATPLQLANYIAAIANNGIVWKPHTVSSIKKIDGTEEKIEPTVLGKNFASSTSLEIVREGMRQTVTSEQGSGRQFNDLEVPVAGKTGTAQFGSENKTHGWFVSFAPYDNPEIAMVVLVEGGGEGHSTAVPVTKEVYKWYFGERSR